MVPTLDSFGGPDMEWPLVERKTMVTLTYDGDQRLVGFVGHERHRDLKVYTTRRADHHYYQNGEGYAISNSALLDAKAIGCTQVLIHQQHTGHVYEFALDQYLKFGKPVPEAFIEDDDDPQTYVPKDRHQFRYPEHADEMFVRPFEAAVEHIKRRKR